MARKSTRKPAAPERDIPNVESGKMYIHCGLCLLELQSGQVKQSPRNYARLNVMFTEIGLQVWCTRHDCNVVHIDFQGQKHPANMTRKQMDGE